ncbi:MAG: glyoxylase-like metal-dependent hydrolase (beta-lactamase superfamily II) [bacterium]|jgi:glyoxylase-like metal-dependent hydrolase (beta-lactamase superfamily II)
MRSRPILICFLALGLFACSDQNVETPLFKEIPAPLVSGISQLADGWNEFNPGGETSCSDGTPYKFFVRAGNPEKLMVYMQGGGACWMRSNCDPEMEPTYNIRIGDEFKPSVFGIFNFDNPDNPFTDYSIVMAPYCSGDVHLGQSDTVYPAVTQGQQPLTIRHRGRANMAAVLDWTFKNVRSPADVFVTGSSAGSIPSPFYASLIADRYPTAEVIQLGDGSGGYRRLNNESRQHEHWGTFDFITQEKGFEKLDSATFNYEKLYIAAAQAHPEIQFSEYDAAEDAVQKRFLALSGAKDVKLFDALKANHADIKAEAAKFNTFIAGGESHTILLRPQFYNYAADGVAIRDWVSDLAKAEDITDVSCKGCLVADYSGEAIPEQLQQLWSSWQDRSQYVEPFKIFDNVYYVGIDWVAAYLIETSEGLILVDSLYGNWVRPLLMNIRKLGLNPADIKYVINTHGHIDHAGGSRYFQSTYGAQVVMTEEDWGLAEAKPELSMLYMPVPKRDIVARDGDVITLGDTRIELFNTPGHTSGVLSLRYKVHDGENSFTAMTLGGVGLNFTGVERTQTYIKSYERLLSIAEGTSVSLPNHAAMGKVFERGEALAKRKPGESHPFVDAASYQANLKTFIAAAKVKLEKEKVGTAIDEMAELTKAVDN